MNRMSVLAWEAVRNLFVLQTSTIVLIAALSSAFASIGVSEATAYWNTVDEARTFRERGGWSLVATLSDQSVALMPPSACNAATEAGIAFSAMAVGKESFRKSRRDPAASFATYETSWPPSALASASGQAPNGRLSVLGALAAAELGLAKTSRFDLLRSSGAFQRLSVMDVASNQERYRRFERAILVVGSPKAVNLCLFEIDPAHYNWLSSGSIFGFVDAGSAKLSHNPVLPHADTPGSKYRSRWVRWLAVLLPAGLVLLAESLSLSRRKDFAVYRAIGLHRSEIAMLRNIEMMVQVAVAMSIAAATLMAWAWVFRPPRGAVALGISQQAVAALLTVGISGAISLLPRSKNVIDELKAH